MVLQKSQNQNIDRLIHGIQLIIENRCSLLDEDVILLREVIVQLKKFKRKRKKDFAADIGFIVKAVELLTKFFVMGDEFLKVVDALK